jgi:prepilin-type processing-associated H-X9-DG protein
VIAIIAILAAMLLPALTKAKAKGQSVCCVSNLRQLQTAWLMYSHDNNDFMPPDISTNSGLVEPMRQSLSGSWVVGNAQTDTSTSGLQTGVLFKYASSSGVYRCPTDQSRVTGQPALRRNRGYSRDYWLNSDNDDFIQGQDPFALFPEDKKKLSQLITPPAAQSFVFIDENEESINDGSLITGDLPDAGLNQNIDPTPYWWNMPSDRHSQGCSISFADGHVERWHWKWPKKFLQYIQLVADTSVDPQQNDRKDLDRLEACVPHLR